MLLDYTNLFCSNDYEKNDNTKIFSITKKIKLNCVTCSKYRKSENLKFHNSQKKALVLLIICNKWNNEDEKLLNEKESIEILKFLA